MKVGDPMTKPDAESLCSAMTEWAPKGYVVVPFCDLPIGARFSPFLDAELSHKKIGQFYDRAIRNAEDPFTKWPSSIPLNAPCLTIASTMRPTLVLDEAAG